MGRSLKAKIWDVIWILGYFGLTLGIMAYSVLIVNNWVKMVMIGAHTQNSWMIVGGGVLLVIFGSGLLLVFCAGLIFLLLGLNALWEAYS